MGMSEIRLIRVFQVLTISICRTSHSGTGAHTMRKELLLCSAWAISYNSAILDVEPFYFSFSTALSVDHAFGKKKKKCIATIYTKVESAHKIMKSRAFNKLLMTTTTSVRLT